MTTFFFWFTSFVIKMAELPAENFNDDFQKVQFRIITFGRAFNYSKENRTFSKSKSERALDSLQKDHIIDAIKADPN